MENQKDRPFLLCLADHSLDLLVHLFPRKDLARSKGIALSERRQQLISLLPRTIRTSRIPVASGM